MKIVGFRTPLIMEYATAGKAASPHSFFCEIMFEKAFYLFFQRVYFAVSRMVFAFATRSAEGDCVSFSA